MTESNQNASNGLYAIEVENLSLYYGDFRAVKDVTLKIQRNKITAIIGPSGCGKSTMLRSFNRMNELVPSAWIEGEIIFEGQNIYADDVDPVEVIAPHEFLGDRPQLIRKDHYMIAVPSHPPADVKQYFIEKGQYR